MTRTTALLGGVLALMLLARPTGAAAQDGALPKLRLGSVPHGMLLLDRLEYGYGLNPGAVWDLAAWVGGDSDRLRVRSEGTVSLPGAVAADIELQATYSRLVSPFLELQVGARLDQVLSAGANPTRGLLAVGLEGTAPLWVDIEFFAYLSHQLDVSFRFTATYELLFTQRLIGQFRLETNIAVQKVEEFGVGRGWNDVDLGFRLRFEIKRQFAPYVGVSWNQRLFETAQMAKSGGESPASLVGLGGLRLWF